MIDAGAIVAALRASRGFAHKRDIGAVLGRLGPAAAATDAAVPNGDDCAVLPNPSGEGWLLFAIEGLVEDFVAAMPWFAGWSAVMVNLSDVAAMGGRPLAVVDALWSADEAAGRSMLEGMQAAAERYGVPIAGGHTNMKAARGQLAVAVLGSARSLITSFAARPGDDVVVAVDLRGRWMDPFPFWNAATEAPADRLRGDLAVLAELAESGLCGAGKDVSMAGVLGSLLMMLECSGCGAHVVLDRLPRPPDVRDEPALLRWLCAFPSYGYVLAVRPAHRAAVERIFAGRDIACATIGQVNATRALTVSSAEGTPPATLWDLSHEPFITGGAVA